MSGDESADAGRDGACAGGNDWRGGADYIYREGWHKGALSKPEQDSAGCGNLYQGWLCDAAAACLFDLD